MLRTRVICFSLRSCHSCILPLSSCNLFDGMDAVPLVDGQIRRPLILSLEYEHGFPLMPLSQVRKADTHLGPKTRTAALLDSPAP